VELGREWCDAHQPAADLWVALNPPAIENLVELFPDECPTCHGDRMVESEQCCYIDCRTCGGSGR
jgi:hypothetical protein